MIIVSRLEYIKFYYPVLSELDKNYSETANQWKNAERSWELTTPSYIRTLHRIYGPICTPSLYIIQRNCTHIYQETCTKMLIITYLKHHLKHPENEQMNAK